MSRTIKFRGKRLDNGKWVYGSLINNAFHGPDTKEPECYIFCAEWQLRLFFEFIEEDVDVFQVDPATVGQFTGLRDKNGREIYEGDVLQFFIDGDKFTTRLVEWSPKFGCSLAGIVVGEYSPEDMWCADYEVIGNIYENPELMEVKS